MYHSYQTTGATSPSPPPPRAPDPSILPDGNVVGVRRSGSGMRKRSQHLPSEADPSEGIQRQRAAVLSWAQQARMREVAAHRAYRAQSVADKYDMFGLQHQQREREAPEPKRPPLRHMLQKVLDRPSRLLYTPGPKLGSPIELAKPTQSPGPGTYNVPSQFGR
jgi:hypothetical protein